MKSALELLAQDRNLDPRFRQAIQRPLPGADFRQLLQRDDEAAPIGYGHPVDISDYKGGK